MENQSVFLPQMLPQILLALEPLPAEVAHDCELVRVTRHVGLEMVLVSEAALANLVESGIETNDQPSFFFFFWKFPPNSRCT